MEKKKPTQEEIDKAIDTLTQLKNKMPQYSHFGDDNHKVINFEIEILKGKMGEPDIWVHGDSMASQLLDVIEWKRGENKDWLSYRLDDLANNE